MHYKIDNLVQNARCFDFLISNLTHQPKFYIKDLLLLLIFAIITVIKDSPTNILEAIKFIFNTHKRAKNLIIKGILK